jgi:hypothetical protein
VTLVKDYFTGFQTFLSTIEQPQSRKNGIIVFFLDTVSRGARRCEQRWSFIIFWLVFSHSPRSTDCPPILVCI